MLYTVESATAYVINQLEAKGTASRNDFDVPAIVTVSHKIAGNWDFGSIDRTIFWKIAACHLKI
ncbi:MAG: hypothetical protein HOQ24_09385 [Mycobacteriaceae bacterium]|nr:hypothetical protein [Mycobacteriaceae bacterium]